MSNYERIFLTETDIRRPWRIAEFWEKAAPAALSGLLAANALPEQMMVPLAASMADQLVEEWRKRFDRAVPPESA